jgi:uncharacterized membrane protein YgaE (UPF0421/DUF939 family)
MRWQAGRARLGDAIGRHPRLPLAFKCAVAAALAWLLVLPLGGVADEFPYYAPLGAVVAVGTTVASSLRASVQGVLALLLGAALSIGVGLLPLPEVVAIASVVGFGTVLAGWTYLGDMSSWVPISGLFILTIGRTDPGDYAFAYVALTGLGAAVGVLVNAAVPPLPLTATSATQRALLDTLAGQLDDLADGLLQERLLTPQEWEKRTWAIESHNERMRHMVGEAAEARRGNWRARRWRETADRQYVLARALEQLSFMVENITGLVMEQEHAERRVVVLGSTLRPPTASALQAMAEVLRSVHGAAAEPQSLRRADDAVQALAAAVRDLRFRTEDDLFAAGTIVTAVRRGISALTGEEVAERLDEPHR